MAAIFPDIDPFVEAQHYSPGFHVTLLTYLRDAIGDILPESYMVRIEERIHLVERVPEVIRAIRPELLIEASPMAIPRGGGPVALEVEPTTIPIAFLDPVRERFIEIRHRPVRRLVTVIELLSPDHKSGAGRGQHLSKRGSILESPAHLVELDFLIGGRRLPMDQPLPPGDVFALVARGDRRPDCEVYAWSIRQPLAAIRLPLLAPDPDLRLDLAAVYATAFERGRYARSIDYAASLTLPLDPEDCAWAEQLARAGH